MPYENESALRLENPNKYSKYKRTSGGTIYGGLRIPMSIDIIWGHKIGEPLDAWHPQALRFPIKDWTIKQAREWVDKNIKDYISFEPAINTKQQFSKDMTNLPIYELKFSENNSNDIKVSFVDQPAIEEDFFYFNEEKEVYKFSEDEKMIVTGPAMIPNKKMYRSNLDGYVYFTQDSIIKFAELLLNKSKNKFNVDHKDNFPNVTILESYFAKDNNEFNVPVGSLILSAKVNDKNLWNDIKSGKMNGFSIEGMAQHHLVNFELNYKKENKMNIKDKLETKFKEFLSTMFDENQEFAMDVTGDTACAVEDVPVSGDTKPADIPASGDTVQVESPEMETPMEDSMEPEGQEGTPEDKPMEHLTREEVQTMLDEMLAKIEEKLANKVAMAEEKIEQFGEQLQPMAKTTEIKLNKYQEWKEKNK